MFLDRRKNAAADRRATAGWFTAGRFAALLGLLMVVRFPQIIAGFETFYLLDFGLFGYPVAFYHRESFWHGEIPLWNPLSNCGTPFLAQWNTMTLYPPSLIYLLFPLSWSLGIFCVAHLFLGGVGMYWLARRWTGNNLAASLAGAVFAFNGLSWYGTMYTPMTAAMGWMPWVVWAAEKGWTEGRRGLLLASLAGGVQMLSGGVEVILLTWLVIGVLWAAQFFRQEIPRGLLLGRMLGMVCLIAALTAAQLFPFLDFLAHSQRGSGYADTKMYALPLMGWANYLTPPFQCVRTPYGLFLQAGQGWTASYYVGAGTVALALLAVWRVRTYRVRLLAALALFSLLMALGGNGFLYDWIKGAIPMLGFLRYPMKFIMLATLVIPLLAACGLSWLQALPEAGWPSEWKRACGVALGLLALMAFILADAWKHPVPGSDPIATARNTLVRAIFLALIFGCLALLHREKDFRFQRWLQAGLIVLVWFDLFTHAPNLSPTAAQSVYEPDAIRRFFHWDQQLLPGTSRALQSRSSFWRMCYENGADAEVNVTGHRLSLFMNFNLLDHAAKFDGFFPLNLKEFNELYNIVNFCTNQTDNLQDFLAISHISNPTNDVDWVTRSSALPMITAGQQPIFADRASTFRAVTSAVFDPPREVYLPPEASPNVDAIATGAAKIVASRFTAQKLEIDVATPVPAMVVIAQTFCHPWHAYVDGKRTALWRANYAFQALEVPAGQHHVRLVYEDTVFHCGVAVSLASLLAIGLLFFKWK